MLIDGYIINVDYTELRKPCAAVDKISNNSLMNGTTA